MKQRIASLLSALFLLVCQSTMAETIPNAYQEIAEQHQIPASIFYTLALLESGQSSKTRAFRPWPWTLTVDAKPYYFDTYEGALSKLKQTLAGEPPKQLGIGLFQIEYRYHKDRFESVEDMLWPYKNTQVAAQIFSEYLTLEQGDLWGAIGRFHSSTDKYAKRYQLRFGKHLVSLIADGGSS